MTETKQNERFHFLDGLRGIASLLIVIHHAFTSNIVKLLEHLHLHFVAFYFYSFTKSGVELFFVLSGVVLLRPYLRKEKKFETGKYFYRRIRRIYPPYIGALLFASVVAWFNTHYPTWYTPSLRPFDWLWTFKQLFIIRWGNFYYNLAWWSLQVEAMFYVLVPLVIIAFPKPARLNITRLFMMIIAITTAAVAGQFLFTKFYPELYNINHVRLNLFIALNYPVCFLMGTYIAARDSSVQQAKVFLVMGIFVVLSSWFYIPIESAGYGMVYGGFIMMAFHSGAIKKFLGRPLMIWLGERSYSLFLMHLSVFYLMNYLVSRYTSERSALYGILTRGIGFPLAFIMAMLLFHFVERKQAHGLLTAKAFWPWQAKRAIAEAQTAGLAKIS